MQLGMFADSQKFSVIRFGVGSRREYVLCEFIRDRIITDTEPIRNEDANVDMFKDEGNNRLGGPKTDAEANFENNGDFIRKELMGKIRGIRAEMVPFGRNQEGPSSFRDLQGIFYRADFNITIDDEKVDYGNMKYFIGGTHLLPRFGGANANVGVFADQGDGRMDNIRWYRQPKIIRGGRSLQVKVEWEDRGGVRILDAPLVNVDGEVEPTLKMQWDVYVDELLPIRVLNNNQAKNLTKRLMRRRLMLPGVKGRSPATGAGGGQRQARGAGGGGGRGRGRGR